ncbi:hypothetical protein HZC53_00440 [Candidatus Uhrbacteria bacterium]|nr:hypothetical protein [Candidatus Uhrbacteria bacterium]
MKCRVCDGRGYVENTYYDRDNYYADDAGFCHERVLCHVCQGHGGECRPKFEVKVCGRCNGRRGARYFQEEEPYSYFSPCNHCRGEGKQVICCACGEAGWYEGEEKTHIKDCCENCAGGLIVKIKESLLISDEILRWKNA